MSVKFLVSTITVILSLNPNLLVAQDIEASEMLQTLKTQALHAWSAYLDEVSKLSIAFHYDQSKSDRSEKNTYAYRTKGQCRVSGALMNANSSGAPSYAPYFTTDFSDLTEEKTLRKVIRNSKYLAEIVRRKPEDKWILESVRYHQNFASWTDACGEFELLWPIDLKLNRLDKLIQGPSFDVTSATKQSDGLISIAFICPAQQAGIQKGVLVLDPNNHWSVRSAQLWTGRDFEEIPDEANLTIENKYATELFGKLRLCLQSTTTWQDVATSVLEDDLKLTNFELLNRPLSEQECSLSAFGLAEPDRQPFAALRIIALVAGIALLGVAGLTLYRSKRSH
ncbi:MAG TPA: hypothetical protein PKD64_12930 [Pirellulaceae bacterium]|mgnify:CR=1 FL=1|nr:hypothetical protein [Pirellulaceae bacterium]HMO93092.1 hypothetical protein [Pirellulaceae bacterium]HMP69957.1 hypothetical protein [Pirellulaceae bacterium]